jgi:hypothetical protein
LIDTVGATQSRRKSKVELGDIMLYDEKERRPVIHELYTIPGVAISDFLYEKSRRFLGQGGALEQTCPGSNPCMLLTIKQKEQNSEGNGKWVKLSIGGETLHQASKSRYITGC